jgi:uroporphyrinogen III methyltransferase/synthase
MLQGKQVVRLKGGCPSVFSRGSSEIAALTQAGITLELVPGVSSALAAPLLAGDYCIALTENVLYKYAYMYVLYIAVLS